MTLLIQMSPNIKFESRCRYNYLRGSDAEVDPVNNLIRGLLNYFDLTSQFTLTDWMLSSLTSSIRRRLKREHKLVSIEPHPITAPKYHLRATGEFAAVYKCAVSALKITEEELPVPELNYGMPS